VVQVIQAAVEVEEEVGERQRQAELAVLAVLDFIRAAAELAQGILTTWLVVRQAAAEAAQLARVQLAVPQLEVLEQERRELAVQSAAAEAAAELDLQLQLL